jgi:hypothetical protein
LSEKGSNSLRKKVAGKLGWLGLRSVVMSEGESVGGGGGEGERGQDMVGLELDDGQRWVWVDVKQTVSVTQRLL